MLVNTCEKIQNLKFAYTLHHIVVSQTTLPVLEPTVNVTGFDQARLAPSITRDASPSMPKVSHLVVSRL